MTHSVGSPAADESSWCGEEEEAAFLRNYVSPSSSPSPRSHTQSPRRWLSAVASEHGSPGLAFLASRPQQASPRRWLSTVASEHGSPGLAFLAGRPPRGDPPASPRRWLSTVASEHGSPGLAFLASRPVLSPPPTVSPPALPPAAVPRAAAGSPAAGMLTSPSPSEAVPDACHGELLEGPTEPPPAAVPHADECPAAAVAQASLPVAAAAAEVVSRPAPPPRDQSLSTPRREWLCAVAAEHGSPGLTFLASRPSQAAAPPPPPAPVQPPPPVQPLPAPAMLPSADLPPPAHAPASAPTPAPEPAPATPAPPPPPAPAPAPAPPPAPAPAPASAPASAPAPAPAPVPPPVDPQPRGPPALPPPSLDTASPRRPVSPAAAPLPPPPPVPEAPPLLAPEPEAAAQPPRTDAAAAEAAPQRRADTGGLYPTSCAAQELPVTPLQAPKRIREEQHRVSLWASAARTVSPAAGRQLGPRYHVSVSPPPKRDPDPLDVLPLGPAVAGVAERQWRAAEERDRASKLPPTCSPQRARAGEVPPPCDKPLGSHGVGLTLLLRSQAAAGRRKEHRYVRLLKILLAGCARSVPVGSAHTPAWVLPPWFDVGTDTLPPVRARAQPDTLLSHLAGRARRCSSAALPAASSAMPAQDPPRAVRRTPVEEPQAASQKAAVAVHSKPGTTAPPPPPSLMKLTRSLADEKARRAGEEKAAAKSLLLGPFHSPAPSPAPSPPRKPTPKRGQAKARAQVAGPRRSRRVMPTMSMVKRYEAAAVAAAGAVRQAPQGLKAVATYTAACQRAEVVGRSGAREPPEPPRCLCTSIPTPSPAVPAEPEPPSPTRLRQQPPPPCPASPLQSPPPRRLFPPSATPAEIAAIVAEGYMPPPGYVSRAPPSSSPSHSPRRAEVRDAAWEEQERLAAQSLQELTEMTRALMEGRLEWDRRMI
eukprot:TRINITY_DN14569_c0_g1_i1.p1 TRINITY_DN14569_c0_g1~~TRINITY_DN14569_c0_g1_i1.p1  ORF type:complete len:932 (+),score=217.45 TRINITY_DN14569_c0_g1_i1:51-2846(+)